MPKFEIPKLGLIACNLLWRELSFYASKSKAEVRFFFQPQGLHNNPADMRKKLQQVIDQIEAEHEFDYLVFGYGLCSAGIEGLVSKKFPMVFARAHDCLTFLLGSQQRHEQIYKEHADAYWYSPGWIETGSQPSKERIAKSFKTLADKYGEEQAEILLPELESWIKNYHKAIYIDLGVGPRKKYLEYTKKCAQELGWQLIQLQGDPNLVKKLFSGKWNNDQFLIVPPGNPVQQSFKGDIIKCKGVCNSCDKNS